MTLADEFIKAFKDGEHEKAIEILTKNDDLFRSAYNQNLKERVLGLKRNKRVDDNTLFRYAVLFYEKRLDKASRELASIIPDYEKIHLLHAKLNGDKTIKTDELKAVILPKGLATTTATLHRMDVQSQSALLEQPLNPQSASEISPMPAPVDIGTNAGIVNQSTPPEDIVPPTLVTPLSSLLPKSDNSQPPKTTSPAIESGGDHRLDDVSVKANSPDKPPVKTEKPEDFIPEKPKNPLFSSKVTAKGLFKALTEVSKFIVWLGMKLFHAAKSLVEFVAAFLQISAPAAAALVTISSLTVAVGVPLVVNQVTGGGSIKDSSVEYIGTITDSAKTVSYPFNVREGQHLFFDVKPNQPSEGCCLTWQLFDPNGIRIFNGEYASRQQILEKAGKYSLEIVPNGDFKGQYAFHIWDVAYDNFTVSVGDTVSNATASNAGSIDVAGDQDFYAFEASLGQPLYFSTENGDKDKLIWTLFDPDGVELFHAGFTPQKLVAEKDGQYKLRVQGRDLYSGKYAFQIVDVVYDEGTVKVGDTIADDLGSDLGVIENPGDMDTYLFQVTQGQHIYLETKNGSAYNSCCSDGLLWELFDPDGTSLHRASYGVVQFTAQKSSNYKMVVWGSNFFTQAYSFRIWDVPPDTFTVKVGDTISAQTAENAGHIELPGDKDTYLFELEEGQNISIVPINGSSYNSCCSDGLAWEVFDPDGASLNRTSYTKLDLTASKSGTFKLVVWGSNFFTQQYSFSITENK